MSEKGDEKIIRKGKKTDLHELFGSFFIKGSIDIPFLALTIALLTIGLVMLFSASYPYAYYNRDHNSYFFFTRQLIFAVIGLVVMFVISKINYKWFKAATPVILVISLLLLVIVLFYHTNIAGADDSDFKRFIPIGPFTFQPSDLAKFALILTLSLYISMEWKRMKTFKYGIVIPIVIIGVFCGLIYLEHHMSCVILMFFIGATLMFVGGSDWKLFAFGLALMVLAIIAVISFPQLLENYAGERITAWLNKSYSPDDKRWQTNNSLYAIGSGGLTGVGLGNSKQKYLYVSEPQNDFIFSIVCEELGFIGAAVIIVLFAALVIRGFIIAKNSRDKFAALVAVGVSSQIGIQVGLNILVVTDSIPNTGIALPFFSYGGTSILLLLVEIGAVLAISRRSSQRKVD